MWPALQGPPRGVATGTAGFGTTAAVLFATAAIVGLGIVALSRRRAAVPGAAIAVHAAMAITGYVVLLAWVAFD